MCAAPCESLWVYWPVDMSPSNVPLPMDRPGLLCNILFLGPSWVHTPNGSLIGPAFSVGLKAVIIRKMHRPCYYVCSSRPHLILCMQCRIISPSLVKTQPSLQLPQWGSSPLGMGQSNTWIRFFCEFWATTRWMLKRFENASVVRRLVRLTVWNC